MSRQTWSFEEAESFFSELVEAARRKPQTVTEHGKPILVVIAAEEYHRLCTLRRLKAPTRKAARRTRIRAA